tara:strand:+ start:12200 stop:13432 length:1233 start_codon:yes stop_codon:yes gene_type:complete
VSKGNIRNVDFLIIGGGIVGLTIARELNGRHPGKSILIIEKEKNVAAHSSGRNSGVLHAGFYYTADSLKARFTRDGNALMRSYIKENGLKINECGKLIIAQTEEEISGLEELKRRGDVNGVELRWVSLEEAQEIDPNVKTVKRALFSPTTATVDPIEVCEKLKEDLIENDVMVEFETAYLSKGKNNVIRTSREPIEAKFLINCAGLYADKIARDYGFSKNMVIMPFKGVYLKFMGEEKPVSTNVYPVPNLLNPFLGVHYTVTVDGSNKIGPTSMPCFWRENYSGFSRFKIGEFFQIGYHMARLFFWNSFGFRKLAFHEMRKYQRSHFSKTAKNMVHEVDPRGFNKWTRPGIRAQLLNTRTLELVMDFVIEGDEGSLHILNAVSPAFTCSFSFSRYVVDEIENKFLKKPGD